MKAIYRCTDLYHGARCVLSKEHTGDHESEFAEWNERTDKTLRLPSAVNVRKGRANHAESRGFKFYLACRQYNREHGYKAGPTAAIIRTLLPKEFARLERLGRIR